MIFFVVTNFNNSRYTVQLYESIVSSDVDDFRMVIVDNASIQAEFTKLKIHFRAVTNVQLIRSQTNLGYFAGLNLGLSCVRNQVDDGDAIVIGNNDLIIDKKFAEQLQRSQNILREFPVISPAIITLDGQHQNPHVVEGISWLREVMYDVYYSSFFMATMLKLLASALGSLAARGDEKHHTVGRRINQGYGACYLLSKRFLDKYVSLWSPTFLMYEEYFLSKQLEKGGDAVYFHPDIVVHHQCHASTGALPARELWTLARQSHATYRSHNPLGVSRSMK